jgi:hypothetical protein
LVDRSESMVLFDRDVDEVVAVLHATVGRHRVRELLFDRTPLHAGEGAVWTWRRYQPPAPRTPVFALTDLGLVAGPAGGQVEDDWLSLQAMLRRRHCPLVLLVPPPPSRWPARLARSALLVRWDRSTTVGSVRRAVGAVLP